MRYVCISPGECESCDNLVEFLFDLDPVEFGGVCLCGSLHKWKYRDGLWERNRKEVGNQSRD